MSTVQHGVKKGAKTKRLAHAGVAARQKSMGY